MDASGSISAAEYYNLIVSLLQNASVAPGPNGDYQGLAFTQQQSVNWFQHLPNHEANLQTFYTMLQHWFNTDMAANLHRNITILPHGNTITIAQLKDHLDNILSRMAAGELWINPSLYTPTPGFGAAVNNNGNTIMSGINNNENVHNNDNAGLRIAIAASLENGGKVEEEGGGDGASKSDPLFIDINKTGHDIMMAEENQNIKAFIDESIADGERPIIIKVADTDFDESKAMYYLYTFQNLLQYGEDANLSALTVYPCFEANNAETTAEGEDNINRTEPLLSLQRIIDRRINIDRTNFFQYCQWIWSDGSHLFSYCK